MRNLLIAVAAILACHQTAAAYWRRTEVTREMAEQNKLPLTIAVTPLGDGTLEVKYEVTRTGPFAHLGAAEILAADGNKLLLQVPIPIPVAGLDGAKDKPQSVKGTFRASKEMLGKWRLRLDCQIVPTGWGSYGGGQTYSVDLNSYLK
jgi:hypothetical protein